MRKGKIAAQAAHASTKVFFDRAFIKPFVAADISLTPAMLEWIREASTKICVYVNSEEELLNIYDKAKEAKIPCSLVKDAGLNEFGGVPTYTAVAIGPDYIEKID